MSQYEPGTSHPPMDAPPIPFRFSPRPNKAAEINWRNWSREAFADAVGQDKPVLLNLTAVWCHWCHVMDETTYSDPAIIDLINERFVPVRVDADQNPHIQDRYIAGGWPTNSFLTPEGDVLLAGTYIPPDQMKRYIEAVSQAWAEDREKVTARLNRMKNEEQRASQYAGELRGDVQGHAWQKALQLVREAYDPTYGGFGTAPKFPQFEAVELLFHSYSVDRDETSRDMGLHTIRSMTAGELWDPVEGGFFRYSTRRDWSAPHYEKMLEGNAGMLENLIQAWRVSGEKWLSETAQATAVYVLNTLGAPGRQGFFGSQDADEDYYRMGLEQRRQHQTPYIDDTIHSNWNGKMCRALIEAGIAFDNSDWVQIATGVLDWFADYMFTAEGAVRHWHRRGDLSELAGLLDDQAEMGRACLAAFEATGDRRYLSRAKSIASFMTTALEDPEHGGFFDVPEDPGAVGALVRRDKPFLANMASARFLSRLTVHLQDDWHNREAIRCLQWFAGVFEGWGYQSAGYGLASAEAMSHATRVAVIGKTAPERIAFVRAARNTLLPFVVVHSLDPATELSWGVQTFPAEPAPAAYVCVGRECRGPVRKPEDLPEHLTGK